MIERNELELSTSIRRNIETIRHLAEYLDGKLNINVDDLDYLMAVVDSLGSDVYEYKKLKYAEGSND